MYPLSRFPLALPSTKRGSIGRDGKCVCNLAIAVLAFSNLRRPGRLGRPGGRGREDPVAVRAIGT